MTMKQATCAICLALILGSSVRAEENYSLDIRGKTQQLHLYGEKGKSPVILSSGDLGWAGLVVDVADFLASRGCYVAGFNSRAYLAGFTGKNSTLSPKDVPGDYALLIDFVRQFSAAKPVLAGVSEGAGLSVLAATSPDLKPRLEGVLGLGLPDQNELGWKWQDFTIWLTKKVPNEPRFRVEDIIPAVSPLPLAEIHSTHDEFVSLEEAKRMLSLAGEPKNMWVIEASNHRFSNNRAELERRLIEALNWIHASRK